MLLCCSHLLARQVAGVNAAGAGPLSGYSPPVLTPSLGACALSSHAHSLHSLLAHSTYCLLRNTRNRERFHWGFALYSNQNGYLSWAVPSCGATNSVLQHSLFNRFAFVSTFVSTFVFVLFLLCSILVQIWFKFLDWLQIDLNMNRWRSQLRTSWHKHLCAKLSNAQLRQHLHLRCGCGQQPTQPPPPTIITSDATSCTIAM